MPLHLLVRPGEAVETVALLRSRIERGGGRVMDPGADPAGLLSREEVAPDEAFWLLSRPDQIPAARAARVRACAVEPEPARRPAWVGCDEIWDDPPSALRWLDRQLQLEARAWPVATVGGLVFRADGRALFVRTAKWSGTWGVPGGKIDYGESCEDAFRREIREETGLEATEVRLAMVQDAIEEPEFHRPRHFVLLNYTARTVTESVKINHESLEWGWFTPAESLALGLNRPTRVLVQRLLDGDR